MYGADDSVLQDDIAAHMWLSLALFGGHLSASDVLDEILARMTVEEIAEAERRAVACLESGYKDCG
jgi:hypothetical protein